MNPAIIPRDRDKLLPDKPSELIRVALKDLAEAEKDPNCQIDMENWHFFQETTEKCHLCFAGAVMRGTLGIPDHQDVFPYMLGPKLREKMNALDSFREGYVADGLANCGIYDVEHFDRMITPYHQSPEQFRQDMENLAADLEANGY